MATPYSPKHYISPEHALSLMREHMLLDGFDYILDWQQSSNAKLIDARNGKEFIDFFTCFASTPLGLNHQSMLENDFIHYLGKVAINKPSNSDIYTDVMATFVKTLFETAAPSWSKYAFFVEGGALAIENALKTAFDWKVRKNFQKGHLQEKGHKILHFRQAFHGRSGYTMSLTNTDPKKVQYFPKFDWPRVHNPSIKFPLNDQNLQSLLEEENLSIRQIKQAFLANPDDIAAIIIEPIQGEGGDNHFRPEFLAQLRHLADENEALLIFDEVQTGVGSTGTWWAHQQLGVNPDIMAFGKKMQVCGILVGNRIDDVPENVFHTPSRINSTWGGNLIDMARATKFLEVIEEQELLTNAQMVGKELQNRLHTFEGKFPNVVSNSRGRGLFCAFDLPSASLRSTFLKSCFKNGLIALACGEKSVRFRPALSITLDDLNQGLEVMDSQLAGIS